MKKHKTQLQPGLDELLREKYEIRCIDKDEKYKNLPHSYWVYDDLLKGLYDKGWFRFAAGFKSALYGNPKSEWCIKLLGMGVGDNPLYFCEKGFYLEHERRMLIDFANLGFSFQPMVMGQEESIEFLISNEIVYEKQARLRVENNDVLIMERIKGVPFATQTGHFLDYVAEYRLIGHQTRDKLHEALYELKHELLTANSFGLLHNDPMPPNIIFVRNEKRYRARLVDFEIAQNLKKRSPDFVNNTVAQQYIDRNVPRNSVTGQHIKNLDQHLLDESISFVKDLPIIKKSGFPAKASFSLSFMGMGFRIDFEEMANVFPVLNRKIF